MRSQIVRLVIAASVAVSGVSHASLYSHGYGHIPTIGPAFLAQASVFFAVAALALVSVVAEVITVLACGGWWFSRRAATV